jgi:hypothetical protein
MLKQVNEGVTFEYRADQYTDFITSTLTFTPGTTLYGDWGGSYEYIATTNDYETTPMYYTTNQDAASSLVRQAICNSTPTAGNLIITIGTMPSLSNYTFTAKTSVTIPYTSLNSGESSVALSWSSSSFTVNSGEVIGYSVQNSLTDSVFVKYDTLTSLIS